MIELTLRNKLKINKMTKNKYLRTHYLQRMLAYLLTHMKIFFLVSLIQEAYLKKYGRLWLVMRFTILVFFIISTRNMIILVKQNTGNCYSNVNSVTSVKNGNLIKI